LAFALSVMEYSRMVPSIEWEQALQSPSLHAAFRDKVTDLAANGFTKADIYASLEELVLRLRRDGREAEEETVLEVMDSLTGWCHSDVQLLPDDDSLATRDE
jgi:hypothetical protein